MSDFTTMADLIRDCVHHQEFQRAVLSGTAHGAESPWRRVVIRKVMLREAVQTQVTWHSDKAATTRNYHGPEALVDELREVPFRNAHIELRSATIEARVAKRGKLLISRRADANVAALAHDRQRDRPIPEDAAFLEVLGVSRDGVVKPTGQRKYRQINEFIRILSATLNTGPALAGPLRVLDLGCGNAYLTFATAHHLRESGIAGTIVGVDRDGETIARNNERALRLGWQDHLGSAAYRSLASAPAASDPVTWAGVNVSATVTAVPASSSRAWAYGSWWPASGRTVSRPQYSGHRVASTSTGVRPASCSSVRSPAASRSPRLASGGIR